MSSSRFLRLAARLIPVVLLLGPAPALAQPETAQQGAPTQQGPASVADLAEGLLDAVVNISTSQNVDGDSDGDRPDSVPVPQLPEGSPFQDFFDDFFNDQPGQDAGPRQIQSLGSGFIVDAVKGIVVTNNHVIEDADEITVNFPDGSKLPAELVGIDTKTDLAVLKIDASRKKLKAVKLGDSARMRIGDWVMAIGNPFGLGGTVTVGIISARNREIGSGPYDDYIQTDAAINRGNSGGPLFNMYGEVIGINTAIISPTGGSIGIGFAIPTEVAATVIDQLAKYGETRRGWLGVRIQEVTDEIAESMGLDAARGALVSGVIAGGPADDGSILPGDVIVSFDGKQVPRVHDLPRIVAESPVGKQVEVVVLRKGQEKTVTVKLGRLEDGEDVADASGNDGGQGAAPAPDAAAPAGDVEILGMTLDKLGDEARARFGIAEGVTGVVITDVAKNSAAAEKGVMAGDVIAEIAQETVSTPKQVAERIDALRKQGRKNALLMLSSKSGELRFVTIRMD